MPLDGVTKFNAFKKKLLDPLFNIDGKVLIHQWLITVESLASVGVFMLGGFDVIYAFNNNYVYC